jgi:hypothetical protein
MKQRHLNLTIPASLKLSKLQKSELYEDPAKILMGLLEITVSKIRTPQEALQ